MNRQLPAAFCMLCIASSALSQPTDAYVPIPKFSWPQHVVGIENYLVYKDRAFAVGAPLLISGPAASKATWSPDGRYMVFQEARGESNVAGVQSATLDDKPLKADAFLNVYSLNDGKASDVLRLDADVQETDIEWIPGSDKALIAVYKVSSADSSAKTQTAKLYILDAASASIKDFAPWDPLQGDPQSVSLYPSPTQSYAFVSGTFKEPDHGPSPLVPGAVTTKLFLMTADELHVPINAPDGYTAQTPVWSEDGTAAYVIARNPSKPAGSRAGWFKVSLINGSLTPTTRPVSFYMGGEKAGLITVREIQLTATNGKVTKSINNLWLETLDPDSQNRTLLAGDATDGAVSKTLQAASYISQGSLYIRPITEIPRTRFDAELAEWDRAKALFKAREAGVAFIMYAMDNDGTLPATRDKWAEILGPYTRNNSILDGFVYSYPGGPMGNIINPAGTQLGYVGYGGGKAVVYADGHVNWVPNP